MKEYKEKVLEFLLQPENFEVVWELYEIITNKNILFEKLALGTLVDLEILLKKKVDNTDWKLDSNISEGENYIAISISKESWEYFWVELEFHINGFENYYGLVRNIDDHEFLVGHKKIESMADTFLGKEQGFKRSQWWLGYKNISHFRDIEEVNRLLPANRKSLVKEYANILIQFAQDIEDNVNQLEEIARASKPDKM